MVFGFPVSTIRRSAFISLRRASSRGFAVALVICAGTPLALASPPETDSGRILTFERNVWQLLTHWFADPPAPPIRFGSVCVSIAQLPVIPATLAGPVAGPMPLRANTCDSLDDTRADVTGTAVALDSSAPNVVALC